MGFPVHALVDIPATDVKFRRLLMLAIQSIHVKIMVLAAFKIITVYLYDIAIALVDIMVMFAPWIIVLPTLVMVMVPVTLLITTMVMNVIANLAISEGVRSL